jgi:linoleoyl-CoA desaturase
MAVSSEAAATRVHFTSGGAFALDVRREVERFLDEPGRRRRGQIALLVKAPVGVGAMALGWAILIFAGPGLVAAVAALVVVAVGSLLTAFCVQHDANHGATFKARRWNYLLGWTADVMLGVSSHAWRVKHNVAHHTYTNVTGFDDDIALAPIARFGPDQSSHAWYRLQHLYVWPLYAFMGLRWQISGDAEAYCRRRVGRSSLRRPRGWDLAALVGGKLIFVVWAVVVPLLVYPWWQVVAGFIGISCVISLVMAVTFQLAHCVEEAAFATPQQLRGEARAWAEHEVETTVDFCPNNRFLTWSLGGLNFQIEHHLFPRIPHTLYPEIAPIVRAACARNGVTYAVAPRLRDALASHFRHLKAMGARGEAPDLELG